MAQEDKKLEIYEYQAKNIENALRVAANALGSHSKTTCVDRDIIQAWTTIKKVLSENIEGYVPR